jgi:anti-anti-sigma factor
VRIELQGEVDLVSEAPFVEKVDALAGEETSCPILLDLAAVDFIDSSGVRALVRVRQQHGERLRVVAVSAPVQRILDIAGLSATFGLEDTDGVDEGVTDGAGDGGRAAG